MAFVVVVLLVGLIVVLHPGEERIDEVDEHRVVPAVLYDPAEDPGNYVQEQCIIVSDIHGIQCLGVDLEDRVVQDHPAGISGALVEDLSNTVDEPDLLEGDELFLLEQDEVGDAPAH